MINQNFSVSCIKTIKIEASCNVSIVKSNQLKIFVSGDDAEKVKMYQNGGELVIDYLHLGNSVTFNSSGSVMNIGSGNVVMSNSGGKNVSIINGEVYINGKHVTENGVVANSPSVIPVSIEIHCPDNLNLDCTLSGSSILGALPIFNSSRITVRGDCKAGIQSKTNKIKISGSGEVKCKALGGDLKLSLSGSGSICAVGEFNDVDVSISGSGSAFTQGLVKGDYEADVSGMGRINHYGSILGSKSKSVSGMGSVSW